MTLNNIINDLNDRYREETRRFLNVVDFSYTDKRKESIINKINLYFLNNLDGLIRYEESVLVEKIMEVFFDNQKKAINVLENYHYHRIEGIEDFEQKDMMNKQERKSVIKSFDVENSNNVFFDLEERVAVIIDSYLARINYGNSSYERLRNPITTSIKIIIKREKDEMLENIKSDLVKSDIQLEKTMLEQYKMILKTIDDRVNDIFSNSNQVVTSNNSISELDASFLDENTNTITPRLDDNLFDNEDVFVNSQNLNNEYSGLSADVIK